MSKSIFGCTSFMDAMLSTSKVEFELISGVDIYLLFEKTMRGRVYYISKRYKKANNKCLKSYEPKQESKHSVYLQVNNLYGYAMSKFLPADRFRLIDPK